MKNHKKEDRNVMNILRIEVYSKEECFITAALLRLRVRERTDGERQWEKVSSVRYEQNKQERLGE